MTKPKSNGADSADRTGRSKRPAKQQEAKTPAVAKATPEADKVEAEKVEMESLVVPVDHLRAAMLCTPTEKEEQRDYLRGIFIRRHESSLRVTATDGHRMFMGSTPMGDDYKWPSWAEDGIIISGDGFKPRLALLAKESIISDLTVEHVKGSNSVRLVTACDTVAITQNVVNSTYPDIDQMTKGMSGAFTSVRKDFEAVTYNGQYLAGVQAVCKILCDKDHQTVNAYTGYTDEGENDENGKTTRIPATATIFTFGSRTDAVLYLMPTGVVDTLKGEVVKLLAPAIRGTVGALKAHKTRNEKWAAEASTDAERDVYLAKAAGFDARIKTAMGYDPKKLLAPPKPTAAEKKAAKAAAESDKKAEATASGEEATAKKPDALGPDQLAAKKAAEIKAAKKAAKTTIKAKVTPTKVTGVTPKVIPPATGKADQTKAA